MNGFWLGENTKKTQEGILMRKLSIALFTMLFLFGIATSAFAAYSGTEPPDTPGAPGYTAPLTSGDYMDNYVGNANNTGKNVEINNGSTVGDVIKSDGMRDNNLVGPKTQRTHGEYQNNTNSCASCHQTHTGASKDLLMKEGVYNTCSACHDGTLGFYNVYATGAMASTAGTFGGDVAGNASVHMADGFIDHSLAPGGNFAKTGTLNGDWAEKFDCASCHAPHGSYSDRLLHYSPNGMGNVSIANKGQKLVAYTVYDVLPAYATGPDYVVYKTVSDAAYVNVTQEPAGTPVIVVMSKQGGVYKRDLTPWLYGYDFDPYPNKAYYTAFGNTLDSKGRVKALANIEAEYGLSYAKGADVATATRADVARVYVTKLGGVVTQKDGTVDDMNMISIANFGGIAITKVNPDIYDEAGYGVAIGKYCGACHTDYRAGSGAEPGKNGTGMYSVAWRHTTNNDRYTCLKCHFAHGTDVSVMKDANDWTVARLIAAGKDPVASNDYIVDKNPSSALKRYTNMAVCWKCHTDSKAAQLKNNTFYWNTTGVPDGGATGLDTSLEHNW